VPTQADDTYVANALDYIHANLDPTLTLHVEYSNEVWNSGFAAYKYAQDQANALWATDTNGNGTIDTSEAVVRGSSVYYGYRAAQIADIAQDVFGADAATRLDPVLAVQTGNIGLFSYMQDGIARAGVGTTSDLFDEYALTTYFGNQLSTAASRPADRATVLDWARSGEEGMTAAFDELEHGGALASDTSLDALAGILAQHAALAEDNGLTLVAYEGGAHLTPSSYTGADQATMMEFIGRLMNDPRMGDLYTRMVDDFHDAGGEMLVAFSDAGTNAKSGYWGVLDNIYQDSSPRYDALVAAQQEAMMDPLTGLVSGLTPALATAVGGATALVASPASWSAAGQTDDLFADPASDYALA
jgi:hypothetical protein